MMMESLQILILEDEPYIALDLKEYCIELGNEVIAMCYDYEEALRQIEICKPNFALVDIRIGEHDDGIELGKKLNEEYGIPFIYITSFFDEKTLKAAKATYPSGYLVKPITKGGLTAAVEIGMANFTQWRNTKKIDEKITAYSNSPLTGRETEILLHLMQGKTNDQIAQAQFVSQNTVKTHLKNIFVKFDVENRGQLIAMMNK